MHTNINQKPRREISIETTQKITTTIEKHKEKMEESFP
jgi:hypothetical protein